MDWADEKWQHLIQLCTNWEYLASALRHKSSCLPGENARDEESEAVSHLLCSRKSHCLPAAQADV